jgi:hypothetical protein
MPLPTCECVAGLPIGEQLSAIYCATLAVADGGSGEFVTQSAYLSDVDDPVASRNNLGAVDGVWPGSTTGIQRVVKAADEPRTSSTVLTDDSALQFPVESGKTYIFHAEIHFTMASTTPGVGYGVSGPASFATFRAFVVPTSGAIRGENFTTQGGGTTYIEAVTSASICISGSISPTSDGTLAIAWRQSNSSLDALTSKAGSFMTLIEV